ncbi:MAG: nicotinate (nicotinamide) nucleotide adenylyltransferase [Planctomycetota bacterium]
MTEPVYAPVGILGGSFNPVHLGHLAIAQQVRDALLLEKVILIPAYVSPFKTADDEMASASDRLAMCRLAVHHLAGLDVCDIDIRRGTVSYAVETLETLRQERGWTKPPVFIIGSDAIKNFSEWKQYDRIIDELAYIVVVDRRTEPLTDAAWRSLAGTLGDERARQLQAQSVAIDRVDTSSTDIRRAVRDGRPLNGLVRRSVEDYIRNQRLYRRAQKGCNDG